MSKKHLVFGYFDNVHVIPSSFHDSRLRMLMKVIKKSIE